MGCLGGGGVGGKVLWLVGLPVEGMHKNGGGLGGERELPASGSVMEACKEMGVRKGRQG